MVTPVLYIAFKRPDYVQQTLPAVLDSKPPYLTIVVDRGLDDQEQVEVNKVIDLINTLISPLKSKLKIDLVLRERNFGCERNVITSINECFEKYGDLIVVEDDVLITPGFVEFVEQHKDEVAADEFSFIGRSEDNLQWFSWGWYITRENWKKYFYFKNIYRSWEDYHPHFQMSDDIKPIIQSQFQEQRRFTWDAQLRINVASIAKKEILFYPQELTQNIGAVSSNQLRFEYSLTGHEVIDTNDGSYLNLD